MRFLCKIGIHIWSKEYEEFSWEEYDKSPYFNTIVTNTKSFKVEVPTPKLFYQRKGDIDHLPEGFFAFQKNHYPNDKIFKQIRICKKCNKKEHLIRKLADIGYIDSWRKTELSKKDIRDMKIKDLLK